MLEMTFDYYAHGFDMSNPNISYKYYHSLRVMNICEKLGKSLNLSSYDVELAKIIGLYHDIGRFSQWEMRNSFDDKTFDHGDYGGFLTRESGIFKFSDYSKDVDVIWKAIENHNKLLIGDNLNERELFFAKLIRDADKLDIIYSLGNSDLKNIELCNEKVSSEVDNYYFSNESVPKDVRKNYNDRIVLVFSFIYDINFVESLEYIKENGLFDKLYSRLDSDVFKKYYEHLCKYIEERIDLDVKK